MRYEYAIAGVIISFTINSLAQRVVVVQGQLHAKWEENSA